MLSSRIISLSLENEIHWLLKFQLAEPAMDNIVTQIKNFTTGKKSQHQRYRLRDR